MLPADMACAKDAKDIMVDCCIGMFPLVHLALRLIMTEWIKLISTQSNTICDESSKKTISPEHVVAALKVSPLIPLETSTIWLTGLSN